jgi:hypothetical protein
LQGGAIDAEEGAIVKIYTSTFESNSAYQVSAWVMISRNFLKFLYVRAGDMQLLGWSYLCD